MVQVCEHTFEHEDRNHSGYSSREIDLFPAVGGIGEAYSMRKNLDENLYELFNYEHREPYTEKAVPKKKEFQIFPPVDDLLRHEDLHQVIDYANTLERYATGSSSFEYGHDPLLREGCPDDTLEF